MFDRDTLLQIVINARDNASRTIDRVKNKTKNLSGVSRNAAGNLSSLADGIMGVATQAAAMATTVGVIATGAIFGLAAASIQAADSIQVATLKYETLLGSAEAAQQRTKEIIDFAARTPFQVDQIQKADVILQGFGIRSEKLLENVGNAAAISGSGFSDLSLIIGQISQSKDLENIKQLVERGVISFEELETAGIRFANNGSIINSVDETYSAVVGIMEDKFAGGMDRLSQTLGGKISTLKDNVKLKLATFAEESGLYDLAVSIVGRINDLFSSVNTQPLIDGLKLYIDLIKQKAAEIDTNAAVQNLKNIWGEIKTGATNMWDELSPKFDEIKKAFDEKVNPALEDLAVSLMPQLKEMADIFINDILPKAVDMIVAFVEGPLPELIRLLTPILELALAVGTALLKGVGYSMEVVTLLMEDFGIALDAINDFLDDHQDKIDGAKESLEKMAAPIWAIREAYKAAREQLEKFTGANKGAGPLNSLNIKAGKNATGGRGQSGWSWVGENGPELVNLGSNATVLNRNESNMRTQQAQAAAPVINLTINAQSGGFENDAKTRQTLQSIMHILIPQIRQAL